MIQRVPARQVRVRRAYDAQAPGDGARILVDRLWPRGLKKEALALDRWAKELAPSTPLREWFGHQPARWVRFCERYAAELREQPQTLTELRNQARRGRVTLVYAAHDPLYNNAVALRQVLLSRRGPARRVPTD